MTADVEKQQLRELKDIADDLEALRVNSTSPKRFFMLGVFQGAGAIVGGVVALALLGWFLSLLGIIPGFTQFETYLDSVVQEYKTR